MSVLLTPQAQATASLDSHQADLLHTLRRLPRRVLQVLLISRLEQLDYATVAKRLNLTPAQVEHAMEQALQATQERHDPVTRTATQWYAHLQSAEVSSCERIDFRRWLDAHPSHLQAFHATELRWRELRTTAQLLDGDGRYRQGRAAFSLGGCALAVAAAATALLCAVLLD